MKSIYITFLTLILFLVFNLNLKCQPYKRICVIGSSTSWGYFGNPPLYPRESGYAFQLAAYYKDLGKIDTLFNIASKGADCYIAMPSSFVPPAGRNVPDARFNITKAVNLLPKPDVIIVNFPNNNYDWLPINEIMSCLQTIQDSAVANGIACYITTTQPRTNFNALERQKLKVIRDSIMLRFGVYAIDFYTDIVQVPELTIKPIYSLGDNIHLNPAGHTVLFEKVVDKNILADLVALQFIEFQGKRFRNGIKLHWAMAGHYPAKHFGVERSTDGENFVQIADIRTGISSENTFIDKSPPSIINYYRIFAVDKNQQKIFSPVVPVKFSSKYLEIGKVYFNNDSKNLVVEILNAANDKAKFSIMSMNGRILKSEEMKIFPGSIHKLEINQFPKGAYYLLIQSGLTKFKSFFIR